MRWARQGQKVGDLQTKQVSQLGKVLTTGVSAARLPGVDVLARDLERVSDFGKGEPAC